MQTPPDDAELAYFFECEPTLLDPEAPWIYNTLTFETERDGVVIWFQISPSYSTLEVVLSTREQELSRVKIGTFSALEISTDGGRETLIVKYGEMDAARLFLNLRPHIRLTVEG
jgi:hypothetical protein